MVEMNGRSGERARARLLVALVVLCLLVFALVLVSKADGQGASLEGSAVGVSSAPVETYLDPAAATVAEGDLVTLTVAISEVVDLYGFQYKLQYNPDVLEVLDADGTKVGIQIESDDILDVRRAQGSVFQVSNTANNATGVITYAATIYGNDPVSGTGTLGRITFRAIGEGRSLVHFVELGANRFTALADPDANHIPATWRSSLVAVGTQKIYLPLMAHEWSP